MVLVPIVLLLFVRRRRLRLVLFFFFQAEDGIRDKLVTGVQTCALPIYRRRRAYRRSRPPQRGRGAGAAAHAERNAGKDRADGHARPARRGGGQGAPAARQGTAHVTLTNLAVRNAFLRNPTRSVLTVLGVMVTAVAFLFLRTILTAWYASSEASAADRIVTRNAISLTQSLPLSYGSRIAQVPGVTRVTWSNWFGGIYKDWRDFFAQFAIDARSALEVFDIRFVQGSEADFLGDRNACIVGQGLAEKFGWRAGDTVPLFSEIYPGDWKFRISRIVEGTDDASIANTMYFHWARLNEGLPDRIKDTVGVFTSKVSNANDSPRVVRDIDALFANSDAETHTETERAFRLQFVRGSSAILTALQIVSGVILVIMALILGNALAMGLRERTGEVGVMRAIGFLPRHVRALAFGEGAMLGALGGVLGCLLARPVLHAVGKFAASIGFLSNVSYTVTTALATAAVAAIIGAAASALPAVQAARMEIVNALRRQE